MAKYLPKDTTLEAARVHVALLRRAGIAGRAKMAFELNNRVRATMAAGVRMRHPDYSDEMVKLAVLRLTIGNRLFREAFPDFDVQV